MPATRITFRDAKENLRDYFISIENTSSFSLPIFITKSKDSDILKFLKTLLRSIDLSREQYYLSTKDSSNIKIGDLLESKMIIFEKFNDEEYKIVRQIKNFDRAPYIPIVAFVETSDKNNIDKIYDIGVDLVFQKSMFFAKLNPPEPDYDNITYFVQSLNKLLIKSDVLQWFWQLSKDIIKNMNEKYDSGMEVISNKNIKNRINEKIKIAFGHLKKPHTTYDFNYDFTNEEFAYLTYWSCLNEYIEDWIKVKGDAVLLKGDNGIIIARRSQVNEFYYSNFKSVDILSSVDGNIKKYFENIFGEKATIYSFIKSCEDFTGDYFDKKNKYPKLCIPIILLSNGADDPNIRGKFAKINLIRNNLDYAHGDKYLIKSISIKKQRGNGYQVFENLVGMIDMLFLLLNKKWEFIDEQEIKEIIINISRLINVPKKEMDINLMRFLGKIKKVIPDNNYNDIVLFLTVDEVSGSQMEIGFIKGVISSENLRQLNQGDKVEVYARIKSGYNKDGRYYQFIQLEDVIKIS